MEITLHPFTPNNQFAWDTFVDKARNGTFLFKRNYMDYHSNRFQDASLLFMRGGKLIAVFPANFETESKYIWSHQGLTYGGLLLSLKCTMHDTAECFKLMHNYYKNQGARHLIYKPVPSIYHTYPAEEPLYALYREGATLISRGISSCISLKNCIPLTESRKSGLRKALKIHLKVRQSNHIEDYRKFYQVLDNCLLREHGTHPVHTLNEIMLLTNRFPDNIKLFLAVDAEDNVLAGIWVFICGKVVHTQYMAASYEGKKNGALDLVVVELINYIQQDYEYLDFGISTENGGAILNEGLIFQKEGFGGRGICYDAWKMEL